MEDLETLDSSFYKVKKSNTGLGLFALKEIKKGSCIIEYKGPILTDEEAENKTTKYLFSVDKDITIDGSPRWNKARYINHSCKGNSHSDIIDNRVFIKAKKNIKPGDEITYDYGKEYFDEFIKPYGCLCRSCENKKFEKKI
jgi:SET domain-containing protein